ncbi:MAG: hypothetical protein KKC39_01580 [Candidatus Omnitrophica bacterium]|nr:hypothetical protein [Candidatus Omnitrophota bacterium]MBU4302988.1 hypothetical protein [Candidatus Omnitrophota bacterium]MBU4419073.1 hypothetical protein [Candidatus Omnitrophota bacterium]MBU4467424.1 hypothetical protein [Candidatus Omnitrophota bacterium]MCG2708519.1 hypothetical protein [Candidatus Omnitrophota bacterium]
MDSYKNLVKNKIIFIFFCFTLITSVAYADAGIPVVLLDIPLLMLQVLVFVMLLEAFIYKWVLKIRFKETFFPSIVANFISTLVGVPIFFVKAFIWRSGLNNWVIYIPELVVLYFLTVFIEYFIVKKYFKPIDKIKIKRAVWIANTASYIIISYMLFYRTVIGR